MKGVGKFDSQQLDWSISPTVQSGGNFDLKLQAEPDANNMHQPRVIISAFGLRYQTYASQLARTYLVEPNKAQESMYKLLLSVHDTVLKELRDGVAARICPTRRWRWLKLRS